MACSNEEMYMSTLQFEVDAQGIALITLNDTSRPVNVVSPAWMDEMIAAIDRVASDDAIRGAIVTSGKPSFMAGADLKYIMTLFDSGISRSEAYAFSQKPSIQMHRRMETCGKPFVAAINGYALGGGFELCLACHHRVLVDDPKAVVGLPEVTVGLLPGSGGTQRLLRLIGVEQALPLLLEGKSQAPQAALKMGLVDQVVPPEELVEAARRWLMDGGEATQPWDRKGFNGSGSDGLLSRKLAPLYSIQTGVLAAKTYRNYPAPIAILDCVFEGALMPFDQALDIESQHFACLLADPVSRNIIRTMFVNKGQADRLVRRPKGMPPSKVRKVGVLGAGLMGSGIAYVSAKAGIEVVLLDTTLEQAEKGKAYSINLVEKAVKGGRQSQEQGAALLARIVPTESYSDLADCDLVVEAVYEDRTIKAAVTQQAEDHLPQEAIFASNTSTLPISGLAERSSRPDQFIGLHFFSPVERMPLVEVIRGVATSDAALARAMDYVAQLRMTPLVVNDSRGFYTSRVFQTFIHEGMAMLQDGVAPALIENAARMAGMPIGPLALLDEVTVELPWKIVQQSIADLGDEYQQPCSYNVMQKMVEEIKRIGRRAGGGFYDYPTGGGRRLWAGLAEAFPQALTQPYASELVKRFLYIQALETARCLEEGVLMHPADGDVGSVLAWGFPSWTGGTLSFIDTVGIQAFVIECERLAKHYGDRFKPSAWLRQRALNGEPIYGRKEAEELAI